jgi:hypothetical protein
LACSTRTCSAAVTAATIRRVSGSSSVPSNSRAIQPGTLAPHISENFTAWEKLETGMIPGTIGAVMPAARHRSRKRRNTSASKK